MGLSLRSLPGTCPAGQREGKNHRLDNGKKKLPEKMTQSDRADQAERIDKRGRPRVDKSLLEKC